MSIKLIWLSVLQSFLLAAGQVALKLAMVRTPHFSFKWEILKQYMTNYWFAICGVFFISAGVLWMYILKNFPLSQAYPLSSIAFVFGMVFGILVFHETATVAKCMGALLIIVGAFLLTKN